MIYLIQSKAIDIDKNKVINLLKIGYTDDNNKNNRFSAYKIHNPLCKLLYTIPDGTILDESKLHHKFRLLLYPDYGKEWFIYDNTIIDFFKNNTTKENLNNSLSRESINSIKESEIPILRSFTKKIVNRWLCKINSNENASKYISEVCGQFRNTIYSKNDILEYLKNKYNIPEDLIEDLMNFANDNIQNDINIRLFLDNFNSLPNFYYRMKLLCENNLSDLELGVVLDQIPLSYKQYYELLGKDRCRSLGYKKDEYDKYISDSKFNKENLIRDIQLVFQVGQRYTKAYIKETLGNIYDSLGYNKTPKANDIEEYFEIKECLISNKTTGKRDKGFELIKIKDKGGL